MDTILYLYRVPQLAQRFLSCPFFGVGHSSEGSISHVLLDSNVVENTVTLNIVCVCVQQFSPNLLPEMVYAYC